MDLVGFKDTVQFAEFAYLDDFLSECSILILVFLGSFIMWKTHDSSNAYGNWCLFFKSVIGNIHNVSMPFNFKHEHTLTIFAFIPRNKISNNRYVCLNLKKIHRDSFNSSIEWSIQSSAMSDDRICYITYGALLFSVDVIYLNLEWYFSSWAEYYVENNDHECE